MFTPCEELIEVEPEIALSFGGINFLQLSDGFGLASISQVEEVGYKSPDDINLDYVDREKHAQECSHLVIRLDCDQSIRIGSERALLLEQLDHRFWRHNA